MADTPTTFTEDGARRIAKAVKRVEAMPVDLTGGPRRRPPDQGADTLDTVCDRGATTDQTISSTNALGVVLGEDIAGGTPNTAGKIKLWAAGDNAYYCQFITATQTETTEYTLPVAKPAASQEVLKGTTAGVLSWSTLFAILQSEATGYSAAKKQALVNDNGTLKWMDIDACP